MLAIMKKLRVHVWEGGEMVDLIETFAPWHNAECTGPTLVDAISCACVPQDGGAPKFCQISKEYPLGQCKHFVAGVRAGGELELSAVAGIEAFYAQHGLVVLGTVADGDCGLDVMLQMMGDPDQSAERRRELRQDPLVLCHWDLILTSAAGCQPGAPMNRATRALIPLLGDACQVWTPGVPPARIV